MSEAITHEELARVAYKALPAALQKTLAPRVDRLGYLGEFFAVAAHQPDALRAFVDFTESLRVTLPPRILEAAALAIATRSGNEYERCQHEQRARALGWDPEWVLEAEIGSDHPDHLSGAEDSARRLAIAVFDRDHDSARTEFRSLLEAEGPATAVGVLLAIGRYLAHSAVVMTVGITSPVSSIFEPHQ